MMINEILYLQTTDLDAIYVEISLNSHLLFALRVIVLPAKELVPLRIGSLDSEFLRLRCISSNRVTKQLS